MADFDELRQQLKNTRNSRDEAAQAISAAKEQLKQVADRQVELDRVFDPDNQTHVSQRDRLKAAQTSATETIQVQQKLRASAVANELGLVADFEQFSDPRSGIERFNDSIPILMMPVRLETRFKTVGSANDRNDQLWVRIYPDDCSIDSFDETLTDSELANGKNYWLAFWQAGGDEGQERAAWRVLASIHGSGRAAWIVQQFKPDNLSEIQPKPRPQEVILTIPTETPLSNFERDKTAKFWVDTWLADGDSVKTAAAISDFEGDGLGQARAAELAEQYVPSNFKTQLAQGETKQTVNVDAAFVVFPTVANKKNAWAHAPKAVSLPDRFVFLGYETDNDPTPVFAIGRHVPSPLITGPDPSAPEAEQIQHDAAGEVVMPEEFKWISDFDRAVEVGMGLRINLTPVQAARGFRRVLVVGLRLSVDEQEAKNELETLFRHHRFSRSGLALVPQGTPTNNTEAVSSGGGGLDVPDESFDDLKGSLPTTDSAWLDKKDGQWVAEYLGIDPLVFGNVHHAGSTDQSTSRAMNIALWPATLGYWMEAMMAPVFTRDGIEMTREFFNHFVLGSGACPAVRIGSQPYGILPATTISRMAWLTQKGFTNNPLLSATKTFDAMRAYLSRLYPILTAIDADFRTMSSETSFVGKPGDPHALLLDIVGLHSGSVEWSQRYAESLNTFYNRLNLFGFGGLIGKIIEAFKRLAALNKVRGFGYADEKAPAILDLIFNGKHNQLKGGVVDDVPLSETNQIRVYTADNRNYIQYLIDAANTSLDALYSQNGFKDNKPPTALLYLFLRHALQLGYNDVSIQLHQDAGIYDAAAAMQARVDNPILHVRENQKVSESRYQPLFARATQITGNDSLAVHQFISAGLSSLSVTRYLREQIEAMQRLKSRSTAQLERAFADHVDCGAYRLDAWLLGIVNYQLSLMRNLRDGAAVPARQGIYLGAYAWLEDLRPENKVLTPVRLTDPDLVAKFAAGPPLTRDSTNEGYIHAPSLNHAITAAVLRNGFISNASAANRQTLAVNLTSERVRTALAMIEGIRAGQSLSDLLGYQFERGLHDRYNEAEVDQYIFKLRREFPIRADRFVSTKPPEGVSIEAIEARNVINGLALVEHIKKTGNKLYPFGKPSLPPTNTPSEADAINAEVDRMLETHDAVADLALSEGVYQAVLGNYDRVASTYDAYARGDFPPEPDVIRTPLNGIGLTHRFALHLAAGADPLASPNTINMTPRAMGEPAVNLWLNATLPALNTVGCVVELREAATGATVTQEVTLDKLDLQPADLLLLISEDNQQAMTELDDRVSRFALTFGPRPDVPLTIRYMETIAADFSVFDLMPLMRNVRKVITKSRPLQSSDLTLMNEADSRQDGNSVIDKTRLDLVRADLETMRQDFVDFKAIVDGQLADEILNRPTILADADSYATSISDLLARAATFAIPQSGWGFAYDFRRRSFTAILERAATLVVKWDAKLQRFNDKLAEATAAGSVDEEFNRLKEAERAISTTVTDPLPATPLLYRTLLTGPELTAFVNKRDQFDDVRNTTLTSASLLLAHVQGLLPISAFDFSEFDLTAEGDEMIRFAQDVSGVCTVIVREIDRRLAESADLFISYDDSAVPVARLKFLENASKVLLGPDFHIVPEFTLTANQGDEVANALAASQSGDLFLHLTSGPDPLDFPIDTWLYGVARVREKVHAWEQTVMFAGALSVAEPDLDALQLPFTPDDRWLGLEFPAAQKLDKDRLLYTAHFAAVFNKAANQCGLLLDEWTETIPTSSVDTGVTFHYDRPNCEAPQTMMLVTPSEFRGAWTWDDLINALNETLDFAKRRAIEPRQIDNSPYAPFLPATVVATQVQQLTIALELALNNRIVAST
jgi:hypothetical protein